MIYKIPIIGFIYATGKIYSAQQAYLTCHKTGAYCEAQYNATWPAFDHFNEALIWTVGFLVLAGIVVRLIPRKVSL